MNIKRLLSKKSWTGKELGKALISSLANDIRHRGQQEYSPLFSQTDFSRMLESLQTDQQIREYRCYQKIYHSTIDSFNKLHALEQQFYHGYYRYFLSLDMVFQAEKALRARENFPLIISRSEYDKLKMDCIEEKRSRKDTFIDIMCWHLSWYIEHEDKAPEEIRSAINAYKEEPAENQRILGNYVEDMGLGHYVLPDGTDQRNCRSDEWEEAVLKNFVALHENLKQDAEENGLKKAVEAYTNEITLKNYKAAFRGNNKTAYSDVAALNALKGGYTFKGELETAFPGARWVYEELPSGITKFDIISESDLMLRYFDGVKGETLSQEEQYEEFKADYPKLFAVLQADLKKTLKLKRLSTKKQLSWGELADFGVPFYQEILKVDDDELVQYLHDLGRSDDAVRAALNGIAILSEDKKYDEHKDYFSSQQGLESLTIEDSERFNSFVSILIEPAFRYMQAFNVFMDILATVYGIPDIKAAKIPTDEFYQKADAFNGLLYVVHHELESPIATENGNRKQQILKDYFKEINLLPLESLEERIASVEERISTLGLTQEAADNLLDFDPYIDLLAGVKA